MSESEQPQEQGDQQSVRSQHLSARIPDSVSQGVFSTGAIVMTGGTEFILDFVQNIGRPHQIVARIVMPHGVLPQYIEALKKNLELYTQRFGPPPQMPKPPQQQQQQRRPTPQEIYDDLKLPDEILSGSYANGVMIGHSAAEFNMDFLTNFFPNSAVSSRVFMSAAQVPRLLESLSGTFTQFQQRVQQQQQQQMGPQNPPPQTDVQQNPQEDPPPPPTLQ